MFNFAYIYLPIIYIAIGFLIYFILSKIVDKALKVKTIGKKKNDFYLKRQHTIVNLIKNIIKYIVAVITFLAILNVYGIKTTSIIASLGILGAIIGLAFLDTIRNLLSGIAIIFDNHYVQGDVVTINGFRGEVIELGLQTTKIKAYDGDVMIINNCNITSVINHSMYNNNLFIELPVSKDVPIATMEKILKSVNKKMVNLINVKKDIDLLGVEDIIGNKYIYKIMIECSAESQFTIKREFMKYLKAEYDKNNINVPGDYFEVKSSK